MKQRGFILIPILIIVFLAIIFLIANKNNGIATPTSTEETAVFYTDTGLGSKPVGEYDKNETYWELNVETRKLTRAAFSPPYFEYEKEVSLRRKEIDTTEFKKVANKPSDAYVEIELETERYYPLVILSVLEWEKNKQEVWGYDLKTHGPEKLAEFRIGGDCGKIDVIDWGIENHLLLVSTNTPSITDSSSCNLNKIQIYDYQEYKNISSLPLPATKTYYYFGAVGSLKQNKVLLTGTKDVVLDINTGAQTILKGKVTTHFSTSIERFWNFGLLPLQLEPTKENYVYTIYNVAEEHYSNNLYFNRVKPEGNYVSDYLAPFLLADAGGRIFFDHTIYNPFFNDCWFVWESGKNVEKVLCSDEIYSNFFNDLSEDEWDSLRTYLVWYPK